VPSAFEEQYKAAARELAGLPGKGGFPGKHPRRAERDIIVIWGIYRGWSFTEIGRIARTSRREASNLRETFAKRPRLIFRLRILPYSPRSRGESYHRCGLCGEQVTGDNKEAKRHVLLHLFASERVSLQMPKL